MLQIRPGRPAAAAVAVMLCLVVGLVAPFVFDFGANEFRLTRVIAAPGYTYEIDQPVEIAPAIGVLLERGTIYQADRRGEAVVAPGGLLSGTAKLVVDDGLFYVGGSPASSGAGAASAASFPLLEALQKLNFEAVSIRRGTIKVDLPDGRVEMLTGVDAEVQMRRRNTIAIRGSGTFRDQPVDFEVLAPGTLDRKAGLRLPVAFRLKSPALDVSFDGRLGATDVLQFQGRAEVAVSDVRQAARWLGAPWPRGPGLRAMRMKGELDWQGPSLAFSKASFVMDGNEATGTLALSFGGARPSLTGTLALRALDVTPYLWSDPAPQVSPLLSWLGADGEESFALGRQIDVDVRLSAARVQAGKLELGRFAASLSLNDGRLLADLAEVGIQTGRGSGQLTADLTESSPRLAVRFRLEDIDAAHASAAILGRNAVQGLSTITLDLVGSGSSIGGLLQDMRGKVALSLREGGRLGIDVRSLVGVAQKGDVEGWAVATRGETSVSGLEAKLKVDRGVIASDVVEAISADGRLSATGTVSLRSRQIDLRVLLDPMAAAAQRMPQTAHRPDVLLFQGPWASPSIRIERQ